MVVRITIPKEDCMKAKEKGPIKALKQWITTPSEAEISKVANNRYGFSKIPPMGWSSKNLPYTEFNSEVLLEIAKAMSTKGLISSGYSYFNIDNSWKPEDKLDTSEIIDDNDKFPEGISSFIAETASLGLKAELNLACDVTIPKLNSRWAHIKRVYYKNVRIHEPEGIDGWDRTDIMEVGNGKLTNAQNKSHFSLWCMMSAPLLLSSDIRYMSGDLLEIVTNKELIEINQDRLGKRAKIVRKGGVNVLAKPLWGGYVAICVFNKTSVKAFYNYSLPLLVRDEYVQLPKSDNYTMRELWTGREQTVGKSLCGSIEKDDVLVYIVSAKV